MIGELISGLANVWSSGQANKANKAAMQKGIQWRVADAKAAGIHPLAALGANMQAVPSQPLLGDAALGGLREGINAAVNSEDQALARRQTRATARLTEAQAMEAEARSRTIAQRARQPPGATVGGHRSTTDANPPTVRMSGHPLRREPGAHSSAQTMQDEYGDVAENIGGALSWLDSAANQLGWETPAYRSRRIVDEYRRYRRLGGKEPAHQWRRRHGYGD